MDFKTYAYNAAKQRNIDPDLFMRLVQQESGWNPQAVSPKGATGLTQAMPATARDPGFGVKPLTNPSDPYAQIDFGADYLGAMLKRYGGDTTKALAAYNWGAGNADKWSGDLAALPEETRNYINIVGGGGGNLSVSSSGGPALQGLGTPEMIKATTLGGGPLPDYMIQNAANRALNTVDYSTSPAFGPVIPNFANGGNFGDPTLAGISTGGGVPVDPALAAPEEEKEYEWLKKLFPNTDKEGRNERLLAIGAGLLSGNNWQEGLAAAGQGLLGVVQDDKNKQFELAQMEMEAQRQAALQAARGTFEQVGSVEVNGEQIDGVMFDPNKGYFKFDDDGQVVLLPNARPLNRSDASGTKMVSGNIVGKTYDTVTELEGNLRTIDRIIPKLEDTSFGLDGLMTDVSAYIKTAAGSRNLSEDEFIRQLVKGELQGQIGSNKAVVGGTGVLTEQDAARIITYLGGDLSKIGDNPAVIVEMLKTQRESKQREYERELERYNSFRGTTGAEAWIELPAYTNPSLNGSNGSGVTSAAEEALKKYGL